ncbi:helix-turn-helix transcriptional regulator [Loigolactobacillus jiayinensis]|uniref:Transcriptional regulator n=1 Tax=Loigolactobacillus jiayinensis TaxID=2486016 RepID=A0ABW1RAY1_9LACO|nr:helix-turn-helix transcriptional regulator [Loigolactobacillus jiayinensis]
MLTDEKLKFLSQIGKALAGQFGENCEIVIHRIDRNDMNHTIVSIENGQVSSRQLGDGPSQIVLETLKKDPAELKDHINYITHTHDGRVLKSSTLYLKDEQGKLEAIFAINYDVSNLIMAENVLHSFTAVKTKADPNELNFIPQNVNELLDDLIQESVKLVGKPVSLMTKEDKVKSIQFLNSKGAFLVTKSGDKVSQYFNISKYTLYSYIDAKK